LDAKDRENQRTNELTDIRKIAGTPEGKRFFERLLIKGRIMHPNFTGNSTTFYLEGHRNLALMFFSDLIEADSTIAGQIMFNAQKKGADDDTASTK
jgi:hypothetical protein